MVTNFGKVENFLLFLHGFLIGKHDLYRRTLMSCKLKKIGWPKLNKKLKKKGSAAGL